MQISVIMKFGGSSLASAERIREVAEIICSFPEHYPCIVLSAMGKVSFTCSFSIFPRRDAKTPCGHNLHDVVIVCFMVLSAKALYADAHSCTHATFQPFACARAPAVL